MLHITRWLATLCLLAIITACSSGPSAAPASPEPTGLPTMPSPTIVSPTQVIPPAITTPSKQVIILPTPTVTPPAVVPPTVIPPVVVIPVKVVTVEDKEMPEEKITPMVPDKEIPPVDPKPVIPPTVTPTVTPTVVPPVDPPEPPQPVTALGLFPDLAGTVVSNLAVQRTTRVSSTENWGYYAGTHNNVDPYVDILPYSDLGVTLPVHTEQKPTAIFFVSTTRTVFDQQINGLGFRRGTGSGESFWLEADFSDRSLKRVPNGNNPSNDIGAQFGFTGSYDMDGRIVDGMVTIPYQGETISIPLSRGMIGSKGVIGVFHDTSRYITGGFTGLRDRSQ